MDSLRIGSFNSSVILNNMNTFSEQFSLSVLKISSGSSMVGSEEPFMISFSERIKSELAENKLQMRSLQDKMGYYQQAESESLLKVDVMHRIRELAIAYKNDTLSESDRANIQKEVNELSKVINGGDELVIGAGSSIKIDIKAKVDMENADVLYSRHRDEGDFLLYVGTSSDNTGKGLQSIMQDNADFIKSITGSDMEEETYTYSVDVPAQDNDDFIKSVTSIDMGEETLTYSAEEDSDGAEVPGQDNEDLIENHAGLDIAPGTFVDNSEEDGDGAEDIEGLKEESEDVEVPAYSFDLSAENSLSTIDRALEGHIESAVDAAISYNMMEFRLDALREENEVLHERLDRVSSVDLAAETVNLVKSKLMMGLGAEMLKLHQNIERDMMETLISSMS